MTSAREVAVVIPCHNAAAWIEDALRSVQAQTAPAAEVVVVDDGSSDDSADRVNRMGVRCVQQPRRGPAAARNRGLAETTAPLVAFLDADDVFVADKLERQIEHLHTTGAALSCGDAWSVRGDERVGRKNAGRDVSSSIGLGELLAGNPVICSTVVARRDALERAGGFDEDPVLIATEDYDLWLRVAAEGELCYLDLPLVEYRVTPGQLSGDERFMRGVDRIMDKVLAAHAGQADLLARANGRRAGVRVDLAYHLARSGQGAAARGYLRQARDLGAGLGATWKTWLRSFGGAVAGEPRGES